MTTVLASLWQGLKRLLVTIDKYFYGLLFLLLGCLLLGYSLFARVPKASELLRVSAYLESYRVEFKGDDPTQVDFKLWNDPTPYWTDEIDQVLVSHSLDGTRIHFEFYSEHGPIFRAGTVKTFGLAVNGRVIRSLESDLAKEAFLLHKVMPILAVIMLAISFWRWPRPKNTVLMPDGSVAVPAVDKGFALSWVNLSPRRKFLRTCWVSGIAVVIVLLAKPKLFWISGTLLGCAFVIWRQYGEWKDKSASSTAHER